MTAAGLPSGCLAHSLLSSHRFTQDLLDLTNKLASTVEVTAQSIQSLQLQLSSLAEVTLQNRRALDLLTAEKGGTCLLLQECCYYVNQSGKIEYNI